MDKQKQIEEMARTFGGCHITPNCKVCCAYSGSTDCPNKTRAEKLYNAGYRKIPEGAVVLTREEYEKLQALKDDYVKGYEAGVDEGWDNARKETAEKFAEKAKDLFDERYRKCGMYVESTLDKNDIDEICKKFTEGKNNASKKEF